MAAEAALMLRRKRQTLNELVSPQIEKKITEQVELRVQEAIEDRKRKLETEIEIKKHEAKKAQDDYERALEERRRKIQEEIDLEKKKLYQEPVAHAQALGAAVQAKMGGSQFESRLNYRRTSSANPKIDTPRKPIKSIQSQLSNSSIYSMDGSEPKNKVIIPNETQKIEDGNQDEKIIIVSRE